MGSSWPIKLRFWHKMPICHPEPADQKYSQSEKKKIWPLCSKGQKSKTLGEENGTINWTKKFLDESKHKKAQFHKSVKYFTQKKLMMWAVIREGGQRRGSTLKSNKSIFKITYISTWKHEILLLATWEITNFELEFLK